MSSKSRVFVVQRSVTMRNGVLVEKHSGVDKAGSFGRLVDLVSPSAKPFDVDPVLAEMTAKLRDFAPDDYILCIGNPILIGWAIAIAALRADGAVTCLQWSNDDYVPVRANIYAQSDLLGK